MLSTHVQPFFEWLYSNTPPPRRHKTKDMQILCLGMSRSGTDCERLQSAFTNIANPYMICVPQR